MEHGGSRATEQGNCSAFQARVPLPHCCEKRPVIVDLLPGAPYNQQTKNCCKGGVLTSMSQDPSKSASTFQMNVGVVVNLTGFTMPVNFGLGVPGYTCGDPFEVPPSRFSTDKGCQWTQALMKMLAVIAKQEGFDGYSDGKIQRLRGASNVSRLASKSGVREALNSDDRKQIAHQSVRENPRSSQFRSEASSRKQLGGFSKNQRILKKRCSALNKDTSSEDDVLDKKTSFDDVDSEEFEPDSDDEEMALIRITERRRNRFSDLTRSKSPTEQGKFSVLTSKATALPSKQEPHGARQLLCSCLWISVELGQKIQKF